MIKHSEEFKQEAVRIALSSGLSRMRVASDLEIGKSTLDKWISHHRSRRVWATPQGNLNERILGFTLKTAYFGMIGKY